MKSDGSMGEGILMSPKPVNTAEPLITLLTGRKREASYVELSVEQKRIRLEITRELCEYGAAFRNGLMEKQKVYKK